MFTVLPPVPHGQPIWDEYTNVLVMMDCNTNNLTHFRVGGDESLGNTATGDCLDVMGGTTQWTVAEEGDPIVISYPCNGQVNQKRIWNGANRPIQAGYNSSSCLKPLVVEEQFGLNQFRNDV